MKKPLLFAIALAVICAAAVAFLMIGKSPPRTVRGQELPSSPVETITPQSPPERPRNPAPPGAPPEIAYSPTWNDDQPSNSDSFQKAIEFYNAGNHPAAAQAIQEFLDVNPGHPKAHMVFSHIYFAEGDYPMALESVDESITQSPQYAEAFKQRALIRGAITDYEEAVADMQTYLDLSGAEKDETANAALQEWVTILEDIENQ